VLIVSERDLAAELDPMALPLNGTTHDWQQRVGMLLRLQGLAAGCPPHLHDALSDALRALRDQLMKQIEDRRSAVSKTACAALAALSAALGLRFAEHLLYFLPVLFRVLPITVQVRRWNCDTGPAPQGGVEGHARMCPSWFSLPLLTRNCSFTRSEIGAGRPQAFQLVFTMFK
jgi:hypothetical protein